MSLHHLFKIPLLAANVLATRVTTSPPGPPPTLAEKAPTKSTSLEYLLSRSLARCVRAFIIALSLIEIFIICISTLRDPASTPTSHSASSSWPKPPSSVGAQQSAGAAFSRLLTANLTCTPVFVLGCALVALGGTLRWLAYRDLRHLFTFEMTIRKNHRLVTHGTYAWVRHPGYTGILCFVLGTALCHASEGSWLRESGILRTTLGWVLVLPFPLLSLCILVALMNRMDKEDRAMKELFGSEWEQWAERVRYKLIPYVY